MTGPVKPAKAPALDRAVAWLTHHSTALILVPVLAYAVLALFDIGQESWLAPLLLLGLPSFTSSFAFAAHRHLFCRYCPELRETMDAEDVPPWLKLRHTVPSVAIVGAFAVILGAAITYLLHTFTDASAFLVFLPIKFASCILILFSTAILHACIVHTAFRSKCRKCTPARTAS